MGRLWECHTQWQRKGYILERGVDSGRDAYLRGGGYILGGRDRVVERGSIFWKEGLDNGSAILYKSDYIIKQVDSRRVACRCLKEGYILGSGFRSVSYSCSGGGGGGG